MCGSGWRPFAAWTGRAALLGCLALASGCAGGLDLDRLGTDKSIVTGSVGATAPKAPDSRVSDEAAIRATVSAWSPAAPPPELAPWVNSNTGSTGAIKALSEVTDKGVLCRTFTASREAFDGVGRYSGKACPRGGIWVVDSLQPG